MGVQVGVCVPRTELQYTEIQGSTLMGNINAPVV